MIIQSLVNYYEALAKKGKITKPGYSSTGVHYGLCISEQGELLSIVTLVSENEKGKKMPQRLEVPEQIVKSSGIKSSFLCENSSYFLGIDNKGKPERTKDCFEAAKELHRHVLSHVDDKAAKAVCAYFDQWDITKASENEVLNPYLEDILKGCNLVFLLDDFQYVHAFPMIKKAWERYRQDPSEIEKKLIDAAIIHGKIKGVKGAQPAGANLVSYNETAFESYGNNKSQGLNAPISEYASFAYVTALNHLIEDKKHCNIIGDTTVVYWAENADEKLQDWLSSFGFEGGFHDSDHLLKSIMRKISQGDLPDMEYAELKTPFHILGIAPNAGRVSIRFYLYDSFGAFLMNISNHYNRLKITKPSYEKELLTPYFLLRETVLPKAKDKSASPLLSGSVMRAILSDSKYPESLYHSVLVRIRAEREITSGKAAIIKAYLQKNYNIKEETTMALNEESTNKAYILGRVFAVLEKVQLEAIANINTTIKDRFFTSACATPGTVFPSLLKQANYHLDKSKYGNKDIGELLNKLEGEALPDRLTLKEQGLFILGYYHQAQKRY
jgi:CRISPR-associated protein Csd1